MTPLIEHYDSTGSASPAWIRMAREIEAEGELTLAPLPAGPMLAEAPTARSTHIPDQTFRIGHPSYQGANAVTRNLRAAQALLVLMARNVERRAAQLALAEAAKGSHVTVCNTDGAVIEVVAELAVPEAA